MGTRCKPDRNGITRSAGGGRVGANRPPRCDGGGVDLPRGHAERTAGHTNNTRAHVPRYMYRCAVCSQLGGQTAVASAAGFIGRSAAGRRGRRRRGKAAAEPAQLLWPQPVQPLICYQLAVSGRSASRLPAKRRVGLIAGQPVKRPPHTWPGGGERPNGGGPFWKPGRRGTLPTNCQLNELH